jgi:ankyrin repeat protein
MRSQSQSARKCKKNPEDDLNETKSPEMLKDANAKENCGRSLASTLMKAKDASTPDRLPGFSDSVKHIHRKQKPLDQKLIEAAENGDIVSAKALITKGANVNAKDEDGATPLIIAARKNDVEMAALLIQNGAKAGEKDDYGVNALMESAHGGGIPIARILLSNGADVGAKDSFEETALKKALSGGHKELADVLRKHGAKG